MAAITVAELLFKLSVKTGAAGNSTTSTPGGSLGKYVSTSLWAGGVINDLFDDVSGAENAASTVDFRCVFLHNTNAANPLVAPKLYLSAETAGGASVSLASDNVAASAPGATAAQAAEIATETTAPVGTSAFSAPTTAATGIPLSDVPSGQVKALWIRRAAANSAALNNDGATLAVTGDTGAA